MNIEKAIIGGLFLYPEEIHTAGEILRPEDFRNGTTRRAYETMAESGDCDLAIVSENLGIPFSELNKWIDGAASRTFFKRECLALKEKSRVSQLKDLGREILSGSGTYEEMISAISSKLLAIGEGTSDTSEKIKDILKNVLKDLEFRKKNKGKTFGTTTGFAELDKITTGGHPGELWIVAGRPGMGKSAFGSNLVENAALGGSRVYFFSMEMSHEQVAERMLSSQSKVSFSRIRHGEFHDSDWPKMTNAMGALHPLELRIDKCPGISWTEMKSRIHKQRREGLDLVVVDFLQRMKIPGENRSRAVGEVTREMKDIAMDLGIWIVCLSQLNRGSEGRKDQRPIMSDLRDSGEIEQDADVIIFPYREAVYCEKCKKKEEGHPVAQHQAKAELIIEKQRNGPAPVTIPVFWAKELVRFENER